MPAIRSLGSSLCLPVFDLFQIFCSSVDVLIPINFLMLTFALKCYGVREIKYDVTLVKRIREFSILRLFEIFLD